MPLFWLSLAFLCGIVCAAAIPITNLGWLVFCLISSLIIILIWRVPKLNSFIRDILQNLITSLHIRKTKPNSLLIGLFILSFALGGFRYSISQATDHNPLNVSNFANQGEVSINGVIMEPPDERDNYTAVVVQAETVQLKSSFPDHNLTPIPVKVHGYVLARLSSYQTWRYGDRILIEGKLLTPPELDDFSYRAYLARQNIYAYLPKTTASLVQHDQGNSLVGLIYNLRSYAEKTLKRIFPEPQAALLSGILLGIESRIPKDLQDAFILSGTAHIIAISGFNITLLVGLFMAFFGRLLGRWRGTFVTIILITFYTILVGANASVVRAALMGSLSLFAIQIGRQQSGVNSLTFLAALMAIFQPSIIWDVSFQLSFAATLGLVLYATPLTEKWIQFIKRFSPIEVAERIGSLTSEWLLFTLAAQLTTLPVILYHFQRLSITSLLANPLILPVQPILMVTSGLALLGGMLFLPLGQALATIAYPFVTYTIRMVELMGNLRFSSILINPIPLAWIILFYLCLLILTFAWQSLRGVIKQIQPLFILGGLVVISVLLWQTSSRKPDGLLHLILLDVNQPSRSGEALLIQTPKGRFILIDGGPSASNLLSELDQWLPLTMRQIDWLVVAGGYDNQIAALPELIERGRVMNAWWAIPNGETFSSVAIQEKLKSQQVSIISAQPGQELDLEDGARLTLLSINQSGALLLLEYDQFRAFLPVGFDPASRDELLQSASFPPVTVWLLANRGAEWLNPKALLQRLKPQLILINAAEAEWSGLPDEEILKTLQGQNVLRSDQNGWIHIRTNGKQMWVEAKSYP